MRQAVAILLLCSLSVHCAGRLGIVAQWWLNRDYVARTLCVNRTKPMTMCGGKCYLAKQLKAADESEQKQHPAGNKQLFGEIQLFCTQPELVHFTAPAGYPAARHYASLRVPAYHWPRPAPDHPPCAG